MLGILRSQGLCKGNGVRGLSQKRVPNSEELFFFGRVLSQSARDFAEGRVARVCARHKRHIYLCRIQGPRSEGMSLKGKGNLLKDAGMLAFCAAFCRVF